MPNDGSWASGPVKCVQPASFPRFSRYGLSKPHSWATAVLVDELDAGGFQGSTDGKVVRCGHGGLVVGQLGAADRGNAE
jgi:hypothetical protein